MNSPDQAETDTRSSLTENIRSKWLNIRRKRFWILVTLLLYTLLGFLVVPRVIHNNMMSLLQEDLGRKTRIEKIEFNPFALSLRIQGFEMDDRDDIRLASFTEFFVNFQLSSLFNRAWTFAEIRLVEPYFFMERFDREDSRLRRIAEDFTQSRPDDPESLQDADADQGMPRLLIHDLGISGGHVDLKDNLPATAVETPLAPINISIQGLNTLPDRDGRQSVTIQLPNDASLRWNGSLTLGPLDSEGELVLDGLHLDPVVAYLPSSMPVETLSAKLSARFDYHVYMDPAGLPRVDVTALEATVADTLVVGMNPSTAFIDIPMIAVSGGTLHYPQQTLHFSQLTIDRPGLVAWIREDGSLNLQDLVPAPGVSDADEPAKSDRVAWQIGIDELGLTAGAVEFSDTSVEPVARLDVVGLDVSLSGFSNQDGVTMPVALNGVFEQGGTFNAQGALSLLPEIAVNIGINAKELPLRLGQPYVQQFARIQINDGNLDSDIELRFSAEESLTASGSAQIPSLDVVNTIDGEDLLNWNLLDIDQFEFSLDANKLHLSKLSLDQLFGKFVLDENKETNLSALMIEQEDIPAENSTDPMDFIVGGILINDSSMDFADLSLPLPFATHIIDLNGSISTIDTGSNAPANVRLEGQVDEFGLARIDGSINVLDPILHTDMTMEFRNLLMSSLSPYTVQFAGREIDQGKLDLDLGYVIKAGLLDGSNKVVLSDLELGKEVDHPDAASLPLGLAVSLLKDSDGVIKVDLPVTGDINDPEFQIGGVIWQAFSGMITKLVSAPFRLLGNLIGIDSEDLGQFEFLAGRSDLTPPELEKVAQLEEALLQRPELVIEISGVVDRGIDVAALKKAKLVAEATARLGNEIESRDDQAMMLNDEIRVLVEQMFGERFPDTDRASIKAEYTSPPASDPEGAAVLDELAYATDLWGRMLDAQTVSEQELGDLARARAQAIVGAFLSSGKFDENRVVLAAPREVESEDDEWVVLELAVASN